MISCYRGDACWQRYRLDTDLADTGHNPHLYENNNHIAKTLFAVLYTRIGDSCFARMRAFRASNIGFGRTSFFAKRP
jgi:hypothetical protein